MKWRGHNIEMLDNKKWIYCDTNELVAENINRNCGYCGEDNTKEGHDKCLNTIKGIMNACCGHGVESERYIQFLNGGCIRGKQAIEYLKK